MSSTQLWIGNHTFIVEKVYEFATGLFGQDKSNLIRARQFYGVCWFAPEKNNYTRSDLEPLFDRTSFALADGEQCCIVIEFADVLSAACANSLLKILEEPPRGYHFILLATRRDAVMLTLQSRALITEHHESSSEGILSIFASFFKNPVPGMHVQMIQEFEKTKMTDQQAHVLLDEIYGYWFAAYRDSVKSNDGVLCRKADRMMRAVAHMQEMPPMPGSLKIFWKNLYLLMTL
jgi:hypothetical protein